MLNSDLAELYGVPTKALIQAVKRNIKRFPPDFMFPLKNQEVINLRSQFVTSSLGHGGRRYLPYVFTEMIASNKELAKRLDELEEKYDAQSKVVFDAIRQLMAPPEPKKKKIGFN